MGKPAAAGPTPLATAQFHPVEVSKNMDKSSPKLMLAAANGSGIGDVTIEVVTRQRPALRAAGQRAGDRARHRDAVFSTAELLDPRLASPIADPDWDGIVTLMEFLLGTNPREYTLPEEALRVTRVDNPGLPEIHLFFRRRIDEPNIRCQVWMSSDLAGFARMDLMNPAYSEHLLPPDLTLYENVEAVIQLDPQQSERGFIRLQARMY